MSGSDSSGRYRRNPNAAHPTSLEFSAMRGRYIRNHTFIDHRKEVPPIHIDVRLPGVKP